MSEFARTIEDYDEDDASFAAAVAAAIAFGSTPPEKQKIMSTNIQVNSLL